MIVFSRWVCRCGAQGHWHESRDKVIKLAKRHQNLDDALPSAFRKGCSIRLREVHTYDIPAKGSPAFTVPTEFQEVLSLSEDEKRITVEGYLELNGE